MAHPLLRSALESLPNAQLPEPISDLVELCIDLPCSTVPLHKIAGFLDDFSLAQRQVVDVQLAATTLQGSVQAEMRRIEQEIRKDGGGEKTTVLERKMKTTPRWIEMEEQLTYLKGLVTYCEQVLKILNNKHFYLGLRLKESLS